MDRLQDWPPSLLNQSINRPGQSQLTTNARDFNAGKEYVSGMIVLNKSYKELAS